MSPPPEANHQALKRRARGLLLASLTLLLAWVGFLAFVEAGREWQQRVDQATHQFKLQQQVFETLARDTDRHVEDLGLSYLDPNLPGRPADYQALDSAARAERAGGGHTLDNLPVPERALTAQLLWSPEAPPGQLTLSRLLAISRTARVAHRRHAELVWSYAFAWPEQAVTIYPWSPSKELLDEQGQVDLPSGMQAWYGYEVARRGIVDGVDHYWTEPYMDAGGRGLMVSRARRLMRDGQLAGVVGADIKLSHLAAPLVAMADAPWHAWVVDQRGHLLADRRLALPTNAILMAKDRVPLPVARLDALAQHPLEARSVAGWQVLVSAVPGTPWLLVMAAPEPELQRAVVGSLSSFGLIALGALALGLWAHWALDRRLLQPMLGLFGHLQAQTRDPIAPAPPPPQIHKAWRPWVARIDELFADWRQAQRQLRQAEALKADVIDHAQMAIIVVDADDRIVEFNPAASALLGHARQEVVGQALHPLICPERFRAGNLAALARMRADDPDQHNGRSMQRRVVNAQDVEIPVALVMWTLRTEGGTLVTLSLRDLREQRAAENVIRQQRDALRQSEKLGAMGSLLANVAHELNNPLTIVLGRASLLEEECTGTAAADDARRIREAAERCGRIVKTFLHMARSRPANRQLLRLNDLARAAVDLLSYTLRSHDIELEWVLDPALPEVMADADQLGQVLLNLLINAQQALADHPTRPRRIVVTTTLAPGWVVLRVEDNGPGVPADARASIFDPFFTTKRDGKGTGLGLAVSRGILRDHGGDLTLMERGAGACFEVRLPA